MIAKKLKKGLDIKRDVSMLQVSMKCTYSWSAQNYFIRICGHQYSVIWFQGYKTVLKTKQFFVQFLTSIKILIMFITQTTKSMKINALQILIKPPYLINFLLQWLLMMQQVLSIATSKLEAFQRDDFKYIEWYSLEVWYLETLFCFFRVETFYFL